MKIKETEYYNLIEGEDENGEWAIQLNKAKRVCQLTLESDGNDTYVNLDKKELLLVRDLIDIQLLNM